MRLKSDNSNLSGQKRHPGAFIFYKNGLQSTHYNFPKKGYFKDAETSSARRAAVL
jgi:hypothetical protein